MKSNEEIKNSQTVNASQVKITTKVITGKDNQGRKTINQYSIINTLGAGSYAKVKLCFLNSTHEYFVSTFAHFGLLNVEAMKSFKKHVLQKRKEFVHKKGALSYTTAYDDVLREIQIMKNLSHPNLVKLYEIIDDPNFEKLMISESNYNLYKYVLVIDYAKLGPVMEWSPEKLSFVPLGNDSSEHFTEREIQKIMRDCIRGVAYLHGKNIAHRDIKPQNILIDESGTAKIGDFGTAIEFDESDWLKKTVGTYHFLAPECCDPHSNGYSGRAADVWALGVTMFTLIYEKLPFWASKVPDILEIIQKGELELPKSRHISEGLHDLLLHFFQKDPQLRIKMEELLKNEWINEGYSKSLFNQAEELSEEEIEQTQADSTPIYSVVMMKSMIRNWKNKRTSLNNIIEDSKDPAKRATVKRSSAEPSASKNSHRKSSGNSPRPSNI